MQSLTSRIVPRLAKVMLAALASSTQALAVGGDVLLPGLSNAAPGNTALCFDNSTGQLGPRAGLTSSLVAGSAVDSDGTISTSVSKFGTAWAASRFAAGRRGAPGVIEDREFV